MWFLQVSTQGVLEAGHAPKQPLGPGVEAVLSEAIQFFNLSQSHPAVQHAGWEPLRFRDAELTETRAELHDALFEYLLLATHEENLKALVPSAKMQELLPKETPSETKPQTKGVATGGGGKKFPFNHTTRAKLLIRSLLLPAWRNSELHPALAPLMWDQIAPALEQLHKLTRRDTIEAELEATFGRNVVSPPGGDQGLHLIDPALTEGRLAEKLYSQVAAIVTKLSLVPTWLASPLSSPYAVNGPGQVPFSLHIKARAAAKTVLLAALPWQGVRDDDFPDLFGNWLLTIDVMEDWLMAVASTAWGAAAGVGWGLALTATLRAYVIDALASLFMTALPLSRLHDQPGSRRNGSLFTFRYPFGPSAWRSDSKSKPEPSPRSKTKPKPAMSSDTGPKTAYKSYYNALLAVGLWECLSGTIAPHPNRSYSGFLADNASDELLGVMSKWKADAMADAWGSGSVSREHADLSRYLGEAARKPCFLWKSTLDTGSSARDRNDTSDRLDWQNAPRVASSDIYKSWPAHPAFLFDVEKVIAEIEGKTGKKESKNPPQQWKEIRDEDHFGTLFSQLSIFVARFVAANFAKALNLTEPSHPTKSSKGLPKPKPLQSLGYEGGSLMWGGCNYTHLEHRFGSVFDISHRFKHERWPLVPCKGPPRQQMYAVLRGRSTSISSYTVHIYFPKDDVKKKIIDKAIKDFDGLSALSDIENDILKGTPILRDRAKLQVNMLGHVALLLTAPYKMIAGSPIMHLRSVRLVQKALQTFKLEPLRTFPSSFLTRQSLEFIFMPDNHYDHWHLVFLAVPGSSGDNNLARGEGRADATKIKSLCAFWRTLGLPLEEFHEYLEGLVLATTSNSNTNNAVKEKNWLLQVLQETFKEIPALGKDMAASRLAPFVELLKDKEFVEWNPKGDEFSKELQRIQRRCDQAGDDVSDGNEILQSRSEHDELMSVDPGAVESPL